MKKLTIQQKAERYDEVLKRAKLEKEKSKNLGLLTFIDENFPELEESEDYEKIKKKIIQALRGDVLDMEETTKAIAWLEKQGEQKPADKVEPKFKVGYWVVSPNGVYWHIDDIQNERYHVSSDSGSRAEWPLNTNIYHRFTIQDAKDGDVLASDDGDDILIFKNVEDDVSFSSYYNISRKVQHYWLKKYFIPATKEQRDTLIKAMADAGYTFDFDKKKLKKIEESVKWSKEDRIHLSNCIALIQRLSEDEANWLKSFKERIQPKQEWKPSDEQMHYLSWIANVKLGDSVVEQEVSKHLNELYKDLKKLKEE